MLVFCTFNCKFNGVFLIESVSALMFLLCNSKETFEDYLFKTNPRRFIELTKVDSSCKYLMVFTELICVLKCI